SSRRSSSLDRALARLRPRATSTIFFFFNAAATTQTYTLSLHDALPISESSAAGGCGALSAPEGLRLSTIFASLSCTPTPCSSKRDRKSTRLNSSHEWISYAVFCLKKKKIQSTFLQCYKAIRCCE